MNAFLNSLNRQLLITVTTVLLESFSVFVQYDISLLALCFVDLHVKFGEQRVASLTIPRISAEEVRECSAC